MFRSYINYIKMESEQVKRFHSALWAGVFTGVFACLYVYTLYDIAPPMPYAEGFENKTEYSRKDNGLNQEQYILSEKESKSLQINTQNSTQSPFAALKSFWKEAINGVSSLNTKSEDKK